MTARVLCVLLAALALLAPAARAAGPDVDAPSAVVVEPSSGKVVFAKNADERRPIASTTKLMTALLTLEGSKLSDVVTVGSYDAGAAESLMTPPLVAGEKLTVADLLRGMLLTSANDAAAALAVHDAGSVPAFVRRMNRRAQQLGLRNTHFGNPIGLDRGDNYSSARDLATLTLKLRKNRFFTRTVNSQSLTLRSGSRTRRVGNRNTLLDRYGWVTGVKTGHTSVAGYCMVSSGRKRGVSMVAVELGAPSLSERDSVSATLLNYGLRRFRLQGAIRRGDTVARIPIQDRAGATLPVVAARSVSKVIPRGSQFTFTRVVPKSVNGPIASGADVGRLVVSADGRRLTSVTLRAGLAVPKTSPARKVQDALLGPWTLIVIGGALLLGAALALLRRGGPARRREDGLHEAGSA